MEDFTSSSRDFPSLRTVVTTDLRDSDEDENDRGYATHAEHNLSWQVKKKPISRIIIQERIVQSKTACLLLWVILGFHVAWLPSSDHRIMRHRKFLKNGG